ncbi:MAG: acyltransferase [Oligoflexia bacterium]|nr:acyltransferase [Oligoflexia bacterium]
MPSCQLDYRPDIDGIRAIAVLSVVGFHACPELIKGGFVGVDIFFVISGFLISNIIFKNINENKFSFIDFYLRRIRRIFPALVLVLLACFIIGWFTLFVQEFTQLAKHLASSAGFINNFILLRETGYFDTSSDLKPLLHLWSLSIEEQFYIAWPLFVSLMWRKKSLFPALLMCMFISSLGLNLYLTSIYPDIAFYLPLTRFWKILIGCSFSYFKMIVPKKFSMGEDLSSTVSVWGLILILISVFCLSRGKSFPGGWALIPTMGTLFLIAAGNKSLINRKILNNKLLVFIGLISYPLYLWHWPLLAFVRIISGKSETFATNILAVILSIGLAWLTYLFIELPIRKGNRKTKKIIPIFLCSFMCIIGIIGSTIFTLKGLPYRKINKNFNYAILLEDPLMYPEASNCLKSNFKGQERELVGRCSQFVQNPKVLLLGDSHVGHYYPGLNKENIPATVIWNGGCPPMGNLVLDKANCKERWKVLQKFAIANRENIKIILLSAYFSLYLNDKLPNGKPSDYFKTLQKEISADKKSGLSINDNTAIDKFKKGLFGSINFFVNNGFKVGIILDIPDFPFSGSECFSTGARPFSRFIPFLNKRGVKDCEIPLEYVTKRQQIYRKIVKEVASSIKGIKVFDPLPYFCTKEKCSLIINQKIAYWDDNHLNTYGSNVLAVNLSSWLKSNYKL